MRTKVKMIGALVVSAAVAVVQVRAQCYGHHGAAGRGGAGCGGLGTQSASCPGNGCLGARCWSTNGEFVRLYDPKTVRKVAGEVVSVEKLAAAGGSLGIHLHLKTGQGTLVVNVGPSWYLDHQEAQIEAKDKIEITGSQVTLDGQPALIAAEIKKADRVLKLRDENGVPMWAGWRKQ
jgi:hypothetical protein